MKTTLLLLLFCLNTFQLFAQPQQETEQEEISISCGTPAIPDEEFQKLPWVGDNTNLKKAIQEKQPIIDQYLLSNRKQEGDSEAKRGSSDPIINVPVFFFVYQESGETGLPSISDIRGVSDHTNGILENSGSQMRLFIHCIRYITDPDYVDIGDRDELDEMMQEYRDGPGINIHVVSSFYQNWAGVYNRSEDGIALKRSAVTNTTSETLVHEIGHFFTLPHTHKNTNLRPVHAALDGLNVPCMREAVSRENVFDPACHLGQPFFSNCSFTGDGFCDTPADPNEGGSSYNEDWEDWLGVPYAPDDENIMSYYSGKKHFSPMQVDAMWYDLLDRLESSWFGILIGAYVISDAYEPDNNAEEAGVLIIGEEEIHSLHDACNIDQDWYFIAPGKALGKYIIHIEKLPFNQWPVSNVRVLYRNDSGNLVNFPDAEIVAQSNKFTASITCQDVANNEIFIRVENNSMPQGFYKIHMESSEGEARIEGSDIVCRDVQYEVAGIPSDATVFWTAPGLDLDCIVCNPVTIQNVSGSGPFTIEAVVLHNGCISTLLKEVDTEGSTIFPFGIVEIRPACFDPTGGFIDPGEFRITTPSPGITYNWSINNGTVFPSTGTTVSAIPSNSGLFTLSVIATDPCGEEKEAKAGFFTRICGDGEIKLNISPNPARDILIVEIEDSLIDGGYLVFVTDLYGELMYQGASEIKSFNLDVSNYANGIYHLKVLKGDRYISNNFVVNKE